jgi:hypothetical protein
MYDESLGVVCSRQGHLLSLYSKDFAGLMHEGEVDIVPSTRAMRDRPCGYHNIIMADLHSSLEAIWRNGEGKRYLQYVPVGLVSCRPRGI